MARKGVLENKRNRCRVRCGSWILSRVKLSIKITIPPTLRAGKKRGYEAKQVRTNILCHLTDYKVLSNLQVLKKWHYMSNNYALIVESSKFEL